MVCPSTPGFPLKRAGQRSFWGSGTQHESKTQTRRRAAMAMATKRRSGSFSKGNQQEIKRKQPWQRDWWKIVNQLPSQPICHGSGDSSYTCIVIFWNDLLENYAVLPSKHESWIMNMNVWIVIVFLTLEELYLLRMLVLRPLKMVYDDAFISGSSCSWCILDGSSFNLHKCPCQRQHSQNPTSSMSPDCFAVNLGSLYVDHCATQLSFPS